MIINSKENFVSIVAKLLKGLKYDNIQEHNEKDAFDITAEKDGEKYCFKCQYEIDAISEKQMNTFIDSVKGNRFDKLIYVTNSSFSVAAKRKSDEAGVILWDRNTFDRMAIGVAEDLTDEKKVVEKKTGLYIAVIAAAVVVIVAVACYFYFK